MPIPSSITDLSTTASSNSPSGSDSPGDGDDFIRALSAFVAQLRDKLNGTSATGTVKQATFDGTASGTILGVTISKPAFSGTATGSLVGASLTTPNIASPAFSGTASGTLAGVTLTGATLAGLTAFAAGVTLGNSAQSGATTLDWYEEGTFTPVLKFGGATTGITYGAQVGRYTRIGRMVHITVSIVLTSKGSASGVATITGLPFTPQATQQLIPSHYSGMTGLASPALTATHTASATLLIQTAALASGNQSSADETAFTNTAAISICGAYEVA